MGRFRVFSIYGFLLLLLHYCSSELEIVTVDVHVARNFLVSGHHFLDVRTEEEFRNGHVKNALNIPYMHNTVNGWVKNSKFIEQVWSSYDKEDQIIVGCKSGVRSKNAAIELLHAEFKHVHNMGGGYTAWIENGFAVQKPHHQEL
ncbi:thiosulfate sulfurtransferase 16, chloroplastic-like [Henckelia pumila]|uniref:thiosulfate sulfurtransferase 16, chloroplastic-like n=1 Tax=Henckelia pumila TaxID=405737 RepID=UPI003C6DC555